MMRSECPKCRHVVHYLPECAGTLSCPRCGEPIAARSGPSQPPAARSADEAPPWRGAGARPLPPPAAPRARPEDGWRSPGGPEAGPRKPAAGLFWAVLGLGLIGLYALLPLLGNRDGARGPDTPEVLARRLQGSNQPAELRAALKHEAPAVRKAAAARLGQLGPAAAEAGPGLAAALDDRDKDVRRAVLEAVGRVGPAAQAAVPALVRLLKDPDADVRRGAAQALGKIGPAAQPAVPALAAALADKDLFVPPEAGRALAALGPAAREAVPTLVDLDLKVKTFQSVPAVPMLLRNEIPALLKAIDPDRQAALPVLIDLLTKGARDVPQAAARELGELGARARGAVPALLVLALQQESGRRFLVRRPFTEALNKIDPGALTRTTALLDMLDHPDATVRAQAVRLLGAKPTGLREAAPRLVKLLGHTQPGLRLLAARLLRGLGQQDAEVVRALGGLLRVPEADLRAEAATLLGGYGPKAAAATAGLAALLKDPIAAVRVQAARALRQVDEAQTPAAVAALAEALRDADIRVRAVQALADFGPAAREATGALVETLDDAAVRAVSIHALQRIGPAAAVPALAAALKHTRAERREQAAFALSHFARSADVLAALHGALADAEPVVRVSAARALWSVDGHKPAAALGVLLEVLRHREAGVRLKALRALRAIGAAGGQTVAALTAALKDDAAAVRGEAVEALGALGAGARSAAPALRAVISGKERALRVPAMEALARVDGRSADSVGVFTALLRDRDEDVCLAAVSCLRSLGAAAREAIPLLTEACKGANRKVRQAAAAALAGIDAPAAARGLLLALTADLGEEQASVRQQAAQGLGRLGPGARDALPRLTAALRDKDWDVRMSAARACWQIDRAQCREAVAFLIRTVTEGDRQRSLQAADVLAQMGRDASGAADVLARAAREDRHGSGRDYLAALRAIDPVLAVSVQADLKRKQLDEEARRLAEARRRQEAIDRMMDRMHQDPWPRTGQGSPRRTTPHPYFPRGRR